MDPVRNRGTTGCERHDDTLSWLYGEGSEEHAAHVASCAACSALLEEHEAVASSLGVALSAIASPTVAVAPTKRWVPWVGAALAMAAGVWFVARLVLGGPAPEPAPPGVLVADTDVVPHAGDAAAFGASDDFDLAIDHLDFEVATLELELL